MDQALGGIMYSPTPVVAAQAFDLGRPVSELLPVRRGDTDTWRLDTVKGSYLIKGYWPTTGGQFTDGQLPDQLEVAMAFERRALEAGVDMAAPIPPTDPLVGWVTRINERLFRAYRWIEHRELRPDDDIADWLGRTMAQIHQLQPLSQVGLPDWWRAAIWPRATWEEWFAEAQRRNTSWSDLAHERLPRILEISARIEALCEVAPDSVMTHGESSVPAGSNRSEESCAPTPRPAVTSLGPAETSFSAWQGTSCKVCSSGYWYPSDRSQRPDGWKTAGRSSKASLAWRSSTPVRRPCGSRSAGAVIRTDASHRVLGWVGARGGGASVGAAPPSY
jgi:hypothetical protein